MEPIEWLRARAEAYERSATYYERTYNLKADEHYFAAAAFRKAARDLADGEPASWHEDE